MLIVSLAQLAASKSIIGEIWNAFFASEMELEDLNATEILNNSFNTYVQWLTLHRSYIYSIHNKAIKFGGLKIMLTYSILCIFGRVINSKRGETAQYDAYSSAHTFHGIHFRHLQ